MVETLKPKLVGAIFNSESETISFQLNTPNTKKETYEVAKEFSVSFKFLDGNKTWSSKFFVKITELGTPKLMKVEVEGSRAKHPKPISRSINFHEATKEEIKQWEKNSKGFWATKDELEEYLKLLPEADSVERWQLKHIEMKRFELFEMALRIAILHGTPEKIQDPEGKLQKVYIQKEITELELKKIEKLLVKKIRQRITPELLRDVAEIYTNAVLQGLNPPPAIMAVYKCSDRTARDYTHRAREEEFLPETTPGKITIEKPKKRKEKKK